MNFMGFMVDCTWQALDSAFSFERQLVPVSFVIRQHAEIVNPRAQQANGPRPGLGLRQQLDRSPSYLVRLVRRRARVAGGTNQAPVNSPGGSSMIGPGTLSGCCPAAGSASVAPLQGSPRKIAAAKATVPAVRTYTTALIGVSQE